MQNESERIDKIHSRAISTEVAERLRLILANERSELPSSLKRLISRLPELDEDSPSIITAPVRMPHRSERTGNLMIFGCTKRGKELTP
jgi:hypothetical protein